MKMSIKSADTEKMLTATGMTADQDIKKVEPEFRIVWSRLFI